MDNMEKENIQNSALCIKAMLLDFLLKRSPSHYFGNEVFYGLKTRAADIVSVGRFVTAFEIKSNGDNVSRLQEQMDDYKRVFDYVYIVTVEKHLPYVKKMISRNIGIILVKDGKVTVLKKAAMNKKLSKDEILASIPINFLCSYFSEKQNSFANEIRKKLRSQSLNNLRNCFRMHLVEKLKASNALFRQEKNCPTHFEDVALLNIAPKVIV
jgi:hypothetical protein